MKVKVKGESCVSKVGVEGGRRRSVADLARKWDFVDKIWRREALLHLPPVLNIDTTLL